MKLSRRLFVAGSASVGAVAFAQKTEHSDRDYWIATLKRIADPLLNAAANRKLTAEMPVEAPHGNAVDRREYTYLEALGRLLTGIAPWLESTPEAQHYADLARRAIASAVDPASADYMEAQFAGGGFEQRGGRGHLDGLGRLSNLEPDVLYGAIFNTQDNARLPVSFEPRLLHRQDILAGT